MIYGKCYNSVMEYVKRKFITTQDCAETQVILDETYGDGENRGEDDKMLHSHPYFELFFAGGQPMKLLTEHGAAFYEKSVVVVPPGFKHYALRGADTRRFFVSVGSGTENRGAGDFFSRFAASRVYSALIDDELEFYAAELHKCLKKDVVAKMRPLVSLMLIHTAELFEAAETLQSGKGFDADGNGYAFLLDNIISQCFDRKITLASVAEELCLSQKQTSRIISRYYGTTLSRYVADKKISAAALMLKNTSKKVADIIEELNFGTACCFFTLFRKKYGCTPLAYRRKLGS